MSRQWKRYLSLSVNGFSWSGEVSTLPRIRFHIKTWCGQTPNNAEVIINNLSAKTAKAILQGCEGKKLTLSAGYVDNPGLIFKGDVTQVRIGRENPTDTYVTINCATGDLGYNWGVVNKSLAPGSTPKDHVQALTQAMAQYGITQGNIPASFSNLKYPRSVAFYGMAKDFLRTLAHSHGCTWSIQNDVLHFVPEGQSLPGGAIVLNANTGMIGLPVQTQDAIYVKALINPQISIYSTLKLDNNSIQKAAYSAQLDDVSVSKGTMPMLPSDGLYTVLQAMWDGDTRGQPWYVTCTCLAAHGATGSLAEPDLSKDASSATNPSGSQSGGGNIYLGED